VWRRNTQQICICLGLVGRALSQRRNAKRLRPQAEERLGRSAVLWHSVCFSIVSQRIPPRQPPIGGRQSDPIATLDPIPPLVATPASPLLPPAAPQRCTRVPPPTDPKPKSPVIPDGAFSNYGGEHNFFDGKCLPECHERHVRGSTLVTCCLQWTGRAGILSAHPLEGATGYSEGAIRCRR
jgi:hypothetical protein